MRPHNGHHWLSREYWTEVGVIPRWQLLAVYLIIVCGGLWGFYQNGEARDDIQESRREAIIISCEQQNERHDQTVRQLDRNIADIPPGPRKRRARVSRDHTVALIDALVPTTDCEHRADRLIR